MDGGADNLTEKDGEELHVVEVDDKGSPITPPAEDGAAQAAAPDADGEDGDDDGEDARLVEDDAGDDADSANRKRRKARQQRRKRAEELTKAELAELRQVVTQQAGQIQQLAGGFTNFNATTLAQRHAAKLAEVQQAEEIMARAIAAQNGKDALEAMRYRDAARDEVRQIEAAHAQLRGAQQQQPAPQAQARPAVAPEIISHAKKWAAANPWYDPSGSDDQTQTAKRIDAELVREGFNPATREFWEELSDRCADALADATLSAKPAARRNAPPVGSNRNHAPTSTRKEIRVTPERKKAMQDLGVWDDPVQRQRYLRSYQEFDNRAAS